MKDLIILEVFVKRISRSVSKIKSNLTYLYKCRSDENLMDIDYHKSILDNLKEGAYLVSEYNRLGTEGLLKVRDCGIVDGLVNMQAEDVALNLSGVLRELQTARDYLGLYLKPDLSDTEKSKIDFLRKELEEFGEKKCSLLIHENLGEALSEGESGHHLACGLISARIIDHIIQSIKKSEVLPDDNLSENIVIKLRELGVLEKDDIANQDKKEFLAACKSSRDALSHKVEFIPKGSQALSLLSYAFIIADIFLKYNEKKK